MQKNHCDTVKVGRFVGTGAVPQPDGRLKALKVTIFRESMRRTGKGYYGWEPSACSSMTNGIIGLVVGTSGKTMKANYQAGYKTLSVSDDVPVAGLEPGTAALLKPGAHAVALGRRTATARSMPSGSSSAKTKPFHRCNLWDRGRRLLAGNPVRSKSS